LFIENISRVSILITLLKSPLEQISIFQTVVSSNGPSNGQIISFRFMTESRRIAAIMRGGDVVMISIEEEGAPVRDLPVVSSLLVLIPL
jgi:hypothetical protein